jgi:hypothetical protein
MCILSNLKQYCKERKGVMVCGVLPQQQLGSHLPLGKKNPRWDRNPSVENQINIKNISVKHFFPSCTNLYYSFPGKLVNS